MDITPYSMNMKVLKVFIIALIAANISDGLNIKPYGSNSIICSDNCTMSLFCRPEMKVLAESEANVTEVFGRMVKIHKPGQFIVVCSLRSLNRESSPWIYKSFNASFDDSEDGLFEINQVPKSLIQSMSSVNPKIMGMVSDKEKMIFSVVCSNTSPTSLDVRLILLKIYSNGTRVKVQWKPSKLSGSMSENGDTVTLHYQHDFSLIHKFDNCSYECVAIEFFSMTVRSVLLSADAINSSPRSNDVKFETDSSISMTTKHGLIEESLSDEMNTTTPTRVSTLLQNYTHAMEQTDASLKNDNDDNLDDFFLEDEKHTTRTSQIKISTTSPASVTEKRCEKNFLVKENVHFSRFYNGLPIIDSLTGYLECTCEGSNPQPEIFWQNSAGKILKQNRLFINETEPKYQPYCCVAKQNFQNGVSNMMSSCWMVHRNALYYKPVEKKIRSKSVFSENGLYAMKVFNKKKSSFSSILCQFTLDNEHWVVIQKRINGAISFARTWKDYKKGFGDLNGEFWLGNEKLHQLTKAGPMKIRFDLWDKDDNYAYAEYVDFSVADESNYYRLSISGYIGTAGDSMTYHNNMKFSTIDNDNDRWNGGSCSKFYGNGGWWYNYKDDANANGHYFQPGSVGQSGIFWRYWQGETSLKYVIMKIAYK